MNIPRDHYVGFELSGPKHTYKVISRRRIDDDLFVYEVRHGNETFEAQQFVKSPLPLKLYLSRKRRIQRLRWSDKFVEEIALCGANVFISHMPHGGIERHGKSRQVGGAIKETGVHCAISEENYPRLGATDQEMARIPQCGAWSGKTAVSFAQVAATAGTQKSQVTSLPNKSIHELGRRALQPLVSCNR